MILKNKEDFFKVKEELDKAYQAHDNICEYNRQHMNQISRRRETVYDTYMDRYGMLKEDQKIRSVNGIIYAVSYRQCVFKEDEATIVYNAVYGAVRLSFSEISLKDKVAKGEWEILEPGSKEKTPRSFTFSGISQVKEDLFIATARGGRYLLLETTSYSRDRILRALNENEDNKDAKWKMKKSTYSHSEYFIYCLPTKDDTACYETRRGDCKILKISKSKEDLLEHLV